MQYQKISEAAGKLESQSPVMMIQVFVNLDILTFSSFREISIGSNIKAFLMIKACVNNIHLGFVKAIDTYPHQTLKY